MLSTQTTASEAPYSRSTLIKSDTPTRLHATVTSKGQITLPVELRRILCIETGTDIEFTINGAFATMKPKRPISDSFGILRHLQGIDTTIPKEADRF